MNKQQETARKAWKTFVDTLQHLDQEERRVFVEAIQSMDVSEIKTKREKIIQLYD